MHLPAISPKHRNYLIAASVSTKLFLLGLLVFVFHSLPDMFDYQNYYVAMQNIVQGLAPWANGTSVMFPPLAYIPMGIAYIISLFSGFFGFVLTMWVMEEICDLIIIFCIYEIGVKLYSQRTAFIAALLYATSISIAFYSMSKFDAFPTAVMMIALTVTVYGDKTKGYLASIAGFFVKLWPVVLFPFLWIYNSRNSSLLIEGKKRVGLIIGVSVIIFIGMLVLGYNLLVGYASLVFCNTIQYAFLQYCQIAGIPFSQSILEKAFWGLMVCVILPGMYTLYKSPKTITILLKCILVSIMAIVFLMQYRSPQYIVWFMPILAILVADRIESILIFIVVQILAFIEFPLAFYFLYTNTQYTSPWALAFFTIYFAAFGLLLWQALKFNGQKGVPA